MKWTSWGLILGLTVSATLAAQQAQAQFRYVRPQTNPLGNRTVSPYVNLGRGGSPVVNYFGLVRPQQQAFQAFQGIDQQQRFLQQQAVNQPAGGPTFTTGHTSYFFNYSHYFRSYGGGAVGQSGNFSRVSGFSAQRPGQ